MKTLNILIFLFSFILSSIEILGQQFLDIKNPGNEYYKKCQDCLNLVNNKPKEILFGIQSDEFYNLYFVVTRKEWFDLKIPQPDLNIIHHRQLA